MTNEPKRLLKALYTIFLAVMIALFFGLGIDAFYKSPTPPEYPIYAEKAIADDDETAKAEQAKIQAEYEAAYNIYDDASKLYNRNVSIIMLVLAVISLVASLMFSGKMNVLPDGLMLGSVFSLIYSIIRGFMAGDSGYRFIIVTVSLLITVSIGYLKFIRKPKEAEL
ncbi:MAG: hypothetical protein HGA54_02510 [Actinobacteria bacterium]|nr:hypothetical protein [Actinomycetota bacterium]